MLPVIFAPAAEALITALVTVAVKKLVDDGNSYPRWPAFPFWHRSPRWPSRSSGLLLFWRKDSEP